MDLERESECGGRRAIASWSARQACIAGNGVPADQDGDGRFGPCRHRIPAQPRQPSPGEPCPPRKPDQSAPAAASPTGVTNGQRPTRSPRPGRQIPHHRAGSAAAGHRPLAQGRRPGSDAAGGLPPAREDHPLRPRADSGARRPRARCRGARRLRVLRHRGVGHQGRLPRQEGHEDRSLHPLLDRARLAGFGRHRPRHPRLRGEVLHRRGHLRPGRQQHAGVLHPGRHQVPRHHPRRQAAAGPGDPAGAVGARHVLGLRVAAHRGHPPRVLEHERPRHPALVPDDGGLRRPHLPAGQRHGQDQPGQVPLEAGRRRALAGVGRGADRRRAAIPTSTAATWPTASRQARSSSTSSASR